jgi:translocation and assembly module TamB
MLGERKRRPPVRARTDWGRLLAFALCLVFGVLGAVPLTLGLLVRTAAVKEWAARKTAALLRDRLGIHARYEVSVHIWPLMASVDHLVVDASDGGPPFLEIERLAIRPRLFSLLAGELDAGDVELVGPHVRAVVKDGALQNFSLPQGGGGGSGKAPRAPLSSVTVTDARLDLTVDTTHVNAREVDLDIAAEQADIFELALRAGRISVVRVHPFLGREREEDSVDEDVICRFDTRVRLEPDRVLVRRLTLQGSADLDPDPGTAPPCALPEDDWRRVEVELGALRVVGLGGLPSRASGRVRARLPLPLVHRFVDLPPATGSISLDVEADYDPAARPAPPGAPGLRLPRVQGTLIADRPGLDGKVFVTRLAAELSTTEDAVRLANADIAWGDGELRIARAELRPFEKGLPLRAGPIDVEGVELPGLLRDLGVHPAAHVAWTLREGRFERFGGTLAPLALEGPLQLQTRGFEIFDRPTVDPLRKRLMGVKEGSLRGTFLVRPDAVVLSGFAIDTPRSHLETTVSLGFNDTLGVDVLPGSAVELEDISPLAALDLSGKLSLKASLRGPYAHPRLTGELGVAGFVFAGFPIGDVESSLVAFEPLVLTLENARVRHGASRARLPSLRVDFGKAGSTVVDATIDTREAPHLALRDLLEILRLDKDPRFTGYEGTGIGTARAHFAVGGPEDRCGGGYLDVRSSMHLRDVVLLGERYEEGELDVGFTWDDKAAGADGMKIDLRSASLRKGDGSVLASASVQHGGVIKASAIASGIPLDRLDTLGGAGALLPGTVSVVASVGGTLSRLSGLADVNVSRVRVGPKSLPPSRLSVAIEPERTPIRVLSRTSCGNPITAPFDPADFERDLPDGAFVVNGSLFGGQVELDGVRVTRQQRKVVTGNVRVDVGDLGVFANLIPGVAYTADTPPDGRLRASLDIQRLPLANPRQAAVTLALDALDLRWQGRELSLKAPSGPIELADNALKLPELRLGARTAGFSVDFTAGGEVQRAFTAPELDVKLAIQETDLSRLSKEVLQVRRASGKVEADLRVTGPPSALRYTGSARLKGGELDVEGLPMSLDDIDVEIAVGNDEARLKHARARLGGGTIEATGSMPVRGLELGTARGPIFVRGVKLPVAEGVNLTADADLMATFRPGLGDADAERRNLPEVTGSIKLTSFTYTRPIVMSLDLGQLTGRKRTEVQTYDPGADVVKFDVNVVSPNPLRFSNNLADMRLEVSQSGLRLSGTNQRFGARGALRILPASKLTLRTTEFEVREGTVRFDDLQRIAPKVDVRAETEYRRYAVTGNKSSDQLSTPSPEAGGTGAAAGASASTGGQWRIELHAHGDADNLQLSLTSDPQLGQEDIILLLTLGMTRTELSQGLATELGETVGLEALSSLTGADKAVKTIVPLIDEFRFGTRYSSRSGRTEPSVTVGKRISDQVRANVTTGLSENREVRASVEVKLSDRMGVQGSYDNANDATSSVLGNVGADLRWRLEFE